MENNDDDNDLKLVRASAGLISDLEDALPKLLWRKSSKESGDRRAHTQVRRKDLDRIVSLIDPFQGDPQLLDARLKDIVKPIVTAYLQHLTVGRTVKSQENLDLQDAVCVLLYTLCKVRGQKVIVGFLNNEPRYFEAILNALEHVTAKDDSSKSQWQTPFILLLWLSHLVLTPFDLSSISISPSKFLDDAHPDIDTHLPSLALRLVHVGHKYLTVPTKAQDAASQMLVRLVSRPDMLTLKLADSLVPRALHLMQEQREDVSSIYERVGPLRFLSGICDYPEHSRLIPIIYSTCEQVALDETSVISTNAVAKKLALKTFRKVAILSLRSLPTDDQFLRFLEDSNILETVIDFMLTTLADRDTPVRQAAAKSISLIILQLDSEMGQQVIQAILEAFKEDIPRRGHALDFRSTNALRWHGLTLALAHVLFKRSASTEQLQDIVDALMSALQFEKRTATGSSIGTNVRDAANFGIWSLARRYTTAELLTVDLTMLRAGPVLKEQYSIIQFVANQLILSACLDPAGNIRRGSSAALQELTGRHPDQIHRGISLVQIVDYHAVGLRRRAMIDVARDASNIDRIYWEEMREALFGWRGIGSPDVPSREAAAYCLAALSASKFDSEETTVLSILGRLNETKMANIEELHGLTLSLALVLDLEPGRVVHTAILAKAWSMMSQVDRATQHFTARVLQSELPSAAAKLVTSICNSTTVGADVKVEDTAIDQINRIAQRLLQRFEDLILDTIPPLVTSLASLARKTDAQIQCLEMKGLIEDLKAAAGKTTLYGAGQAIALATLISLPSYTATSVEILAALQALGDILRAANVEWRVIALKAIKFAISKMRAEDFSHQSLKIMEQALHLGMNDYTIDSRGDVGSLVRLEGISCASVLFASQAVTAHAVDLEPLKADIVRLSLEKLDRVRIAAARCRASFLGFDVHIEDNASVSSLDYFQRALQPLRSASLHWEHAALLEGVISSAGFCAEPLLQACRAAILQQLSRCELGLLSQHLTTFSNLFQSQVQDISISTRPWLEFLAFIIEMGILDRLLTMENAETPFKWRTLLSTVQKSHHKSSDVPILLAAIQVYRGLADVPMLRQDVIRKLLSMLKTNPYPSVRVNVAETMFFVVGNDVLLDKNWAQQPSQNKAVHDELLAEHVTRHGISAAS